MLRVTRKNKIKITGLLFLFFACPFNSICQSKNFTLKIHFDNSSVRTLFISEAYYYKLKPYHVAKIKSDSSNVNNNTYLFKGTILYPTAIRLYPSDDAKYFNVLLFIDTGYQEIYIIKKDSSYIVKGNTSVEEAHQRFLKEMNIHSMDKKIEGRKFLSYVQKNPNSYIGLFALIDQSFRYSGSDFLWKIKDAFGKTIKQTEAYKYYKALYAPNKNLANYIVYTKEKKPLQLNFANRKKKYTLLIFWFLGCGPCRKEMEQMKGEYTEDLRKKFDIITIDTDEKKYFSEGLTYINKQKFPWKNYWDWNEENIIKYIFMSHFPSNFLLDPAGSIVAKDVDFKTINGFLK